MSKNRLFPEPQRGSDDDKAGSAHNFKRVATKIFSVPKSELDEREKQWRQRKTRSTR